MKGKATSPANEPVNTTSTGPCWEFLRRDGRNALVMKYGNRILMFRMFVMKSSLDWSILSRYLVSA